MELVSMFDLFKMGEQWQRCIWHNLKLNLEFEFAIQFQYTSIKLNVPQISTLYIMDNLSCACAFYFNVAPLCWWLIRWETFRDGDHPRRRRRPVNPCNVKQGKQTPIDHVYKILLPSQSRLCMFRRSPRHVLSHSWTHSDAWPIFCHHIKQTTILADIGVEWWECGPCNCYCLLLLSVMMRLLWCESGWFWSC